MILHIIITILCFIIIIPSFIKEAKNDSELRSAGLVILILMICPIFNLMTLCFILKEEYPNVKKKIEKRKYAKKHPELVSLNILKDICKIYSDNLTNNKDTDSRKTIIAFVNKLNSLIDTLETNHKKPDYARILSLYELSFALIKSTLEESKLVNEELTNELLLISKESIEQAMVEVQGLSDKETRMKNESNEVIRNSFINGLREDQAYHKKRLENSI
mgnify:CR=1 FL=1